MVIEADFKREYDIDLVEALPDMSWRRFSILLGGLSGNSRFAGIVHQEASVISDQKQQEQYVKSLLG